MEAHDMAEAIAYELNEGTWTAHAVWDTIEFTNEDGEKFRLVVDKVEDF